MIILINRRGSEMFLREAIVSNMSTEAYAYEIYEGIIKKRLNAHIKKIFIKP